MDLVSTTCNWNVGDDLIREGVLRLLRASTRPKIYIDRHQYDGGYGYRISQQLPPLDTLARQAERFIVAGTPEWGEALRPIYEACARHRVPILLVGVGMHAKSPELLEMIRPHVQVATARDTIAYRELNEAGIETELFVDPALHARYPHTLEQSRVLNYRCQDKPGRHDHSADDWYLQAAARFQPHLITVHTPSEYEPARELFGNAFEVFFSSNPEDYKIIYASADQYVGGRIHGAVPTVATGGRAVVLYTRSKKDCLSVLNDRLVTLDGKWGPTYITDIRENPEDALERMPSSASDEKIDEEREAHADYLGRD